MDSIQRGDRVRVGGKEGNVRRVWRLVHSDDIEVEVEYDDSKLRNEVFLATQVEKI